MKKTENDKKNIDLKRSPDRVGIDINIARYPIFASKSARGYRVLPARIETVDGIKITRTVSVGTYRDTNRTLDTFDELVFISAYGAWERAGCNMEDRRLVAALTHTLAKKNLPMLVNGAPNGRHRRYGARDFERLRESLDKLANIGITYDESYEKKSGWSTEMITLLKKVKLFNRTQSLKEGGKYFELTELCLNEDICQNIKDKKFKLFYLEELAAIHGEAGKLIYNRLELLGGVIQSPFRRDALEFAKECGIEISAKRERKTIEKLRQACAELTGKILTCGVIENCFIENEHSGRSVKRSFVCHISKVTSIQKRIVPTHTEVKRESERQEENRIFKKYESLPEKVRENIQDRAKEISQKKYNGFLPQPSLIEAIREFFSLKNLDTEVKSLSFHEPPCLVCYLGAADYAHLLIDAIFPPIPSVVQ